MDTSDSTTRWCQKLEKVGVTIFVISCLGNIGVHQAYNTVLGALMILIAYQRIGRLNAVTGVLVAVSLITDIAYLALRSSDWEKLTGEYQFGMATLIMTLLVKLVALGIMYFLYADLGTTWPSDHSTAPPPTQYQGFSSTSSLPGPSGSSGQVGADAGFQQPQAGYQQQAGYVQQPQDPSSRL